MQSHLSFTPRLPLPNIIDEALQDSCYDGWNKDYDRGNVGWKVLLVNKIIDGKPQVRLVLDSNHF